MKKTVLCITLICVLCLAAACASQPQSPPASEPVPSDSLPEPTPAPVESAPDEPAPVESAPDEPASIESAPDGPAIEMDREKLEAMLPIFSAIINASAYSEYNPADTEYFWTAIYFVAVNNGTAHPLAEIMPNNIEIKIPSMLVEEYAIALFADYSNLPELPNDIDMPITYSYDYDAYLFMMSDQGDMEYAIDSFAPLGNDKIAVGVNMNSLSDDYSEVYEFVVTANPSVSGIVDPVFYYSVVSVEPVS